MACSKSDSIMLMVSIPADSLIFMHAHAYGLWILLAFLFEYRMEKCPKAIVTISLFTYSSVWETLGVPFRNMGLNWIINGAYLPSYLHSLVDILGPRHLASYEQWSLKKRLIFLLEWLNLLANFHWGKNWKKDYLMTTTMLMAILLQCEHFCCNFSLIFVVWAYVLVPLFFTS